MKNPLASEDVHDVVRYNSEKLINMVMTYMVEILKALK